MKSKYKLNQKFFWGTRKNEHSTISDIYIGQRSNIYLLKNYWDNSLYSEKTITENINNGHYAFSLKLLIKKEEERKEKNKKYTIKDLKRRIRQQQTELKKLTT